MAELNLKQIIDKLNAEFTGENRKFVTDAERSIHQELPKNWRKFISYKSGNMIAFLDHLRNHMLYCQKYDQLSDQVADFLHATEEFAKYQTEVLLDCDSFACIDQQVIHWIVERLNGEDCLAKLGSYDIPQICEMRTKMHFGRKYKCVYQMLESEFWMINHVNDKVPTGFENIIDNYVADGYLIDFHYRIFYYNYDQLEDRAEFENLRDLVENIYTNEYLGKLLPKWNQGLLEPDSISCIPLQRDFFHKFVRNSHVKTVVIISDAMLYEVGRQLYQKMLDNPKCTVKLQAMLSVLPSYTRLGMEALLPHKTLKPVRKQCRR